MKKKKLLYIVIGILVLFGIYIGSTYNSLMKKEESVKKYWSDVERNYQRRAELIPSLVATVSGMADFEKNALQEIAEARANLNNITISSNQEPTAENIAKQEELQKRIASNANRLIAVIENYPNLRGTEGFLALQTQLEGTERRIKVARQDYNQAVEKLNVGVRNFPSNIVAKIFGFTTRNGFAANPGAEKAVEFSFN